MEKNLKTNFVDDKLSKSLTDLSDIIDSNNIISDLNGLLGQIRIPEPCDVKTEEEFETAGKFDKICLPLNIPESKRIDLIANEIRKIDNLLGDATKFKFGVLPELKFLDKDCADEFNDKITQLAKLESNRLIEDLTNKTNKVPGALINLFYSIIEYRFLVNSMMYYCSKFDTSYIDKFKTLIRNNNISTSTTDIVCSRIISYVNSLSAVLDSQLIFNSPTIDATNENNYTSNIESIFSVFVSQLSNNTVMVVDSRLLYRIEQKNELITSGLVYEFLNSVSSDKLTNDEKKDSKLIDIIKAKYKLALEIIIASTNQQINSGDNLSEISSIFIFRDSKKQVIIDKIDSAYSNIKSSIDDLVAYFDSANPTTSGQALLNKMKTITCCGKTLVPADISMPDLQTAVDTSAGNEDSHTFSHKGKPTMLELKYWQIYAGYLSLIGLLPNYWAKGIMIPTPGGPQYLPCPIIWTPLFVIHTPVNIMVMFLTINGMLPFPVMWELRFKPLANNESFLLMAMRGANLSIKANTGNKVAGYPVVANIDTNPPLSKTLPYSQDDVPILENLSLTNAVWLVYLNQWLSTICPKMGFIP